MKPLGAKQTFPMGGVSMAVFTKNQCQTFIYRYFLRQGWLPPGTTRHNWGDVTMKMLYMDDPPLPSDPHYQKKKAALDLQDHFLTFGGGIESPLAQLKKPTLTLRELAEWCSENQVG